MANFVISPNMNLPVPTPGVDPGPDWAINIQSSLNIVDGHNHSNGYGVPINPSGININADLPINSNNLTLVNTVRFVNLASSLAGSSPNIGCLYEAANNLYFNDGAGNVVQITAAGAVNATSSGISSGTASAAFSGGVLIVDSNTNTPANIQCGSILIGNVIASSNFATLSCPSSLGASYDLTLPPTNGTGGTVFMTYDDSNNMGVGVAISAGITSSNLANGAVTLVKMAAPNIVISSSSGTFSVVGGPTQITNFSLAITTSGKPVTISFQSDGTDNNPTFATTADVTGVSTLVIKRSGTAVSYASLYGTSAGNPTSFPAGGFTFIDQPSAGTYTYSAFLITNGVFTAYAQYLVMVVREL